MPEAKIEISLRRAQVDGCAPDLEVSPAQLHVKPSTHVRWTVKNADSFTIAFKGAPQWLKPTSRGGVVTLEVPPGAPPGTYSYALEGTAKFGDEKQPVIFNITSCPEIIIQ